jgi:hypothetical protein
MPQDRSGKKPDCYKCKHRRNIPGDAHSSCARIGDPFLGFATVMSGKNPLNIKANQYGVERGWFNWPLNFDPIWLESCDGFEKKD